MKVVILVDGGNVQGAWVSSEAIELEVVDFDNLRAEGLMEGEREARLWDAVKDLREITWR